MRTYHLGSEKDRASRRRRSLSCPLGVVPSLARKDLSPPAATLAVTAQPAPHPPNNLLRQKLLKRLASNFVMARRRTYAATSDAFPDSAPLPLPRPRRLTLGILGASVRVLARGCTA